MNTPTTDALTPTTDTLDDLRRRDLRPFDGNRPEWAHVRAMVDEVERAEIIVERLIPATPVADVARAWYIALRQGAVDPAYLGQYTGDLGLILALTFALGQALANLPARVPFTGEDATDRVRVLALVGYELRLRVLARTFAEYLGQPFDHPLVRAGHVRRHLARYVDEADDENRLDDLGFDCAEFRP